MAGRAFLATSLVFSGIGCVKTSWLYPSYLVVQVYPVLRGCASAHRVQYGLGYLVITLSRPTSQGMSTG